MRYGTALKVRGGRTVYVLATRRDGAEIVYCETREFQKAYGELRYYVESASKLLPDTDTDQAEPTSGDSHK